MSYHQRLPLRVTFNQQQDIINSLYATGKEATLLQVHAAIEDAAENPSCEEAEHGYHYMCSHVRELLRPSLTLEQVVEIVEQALAVEGRSVRERANNIAQALAGSTVEG